MSHVPDPHVLHTSGSSCEFCATLWTQGPLGSSSTPQVGVKQEGSGQATALKKNDIAVGHDKNWLEPTRSKMAEDLTSSRP